MLSPMGKNINNILICAWTTMILCRQNGPDPKGDAIGLP